MRWLVMAMSLLVLAAALTPLHPVEQAQAPDQGRAEPQRADQEHRAAQQVELERQPAADREERQQELAQEHSQPTPWKTIPGRVCWLLSPSTGHGIKGLSGLLQPAPRMDQPRPARGEC
jgi:hemolysin activation/secretion protein